MPKAHYHVHKNLSLHSTLSQMNPIHTITSCFFKTPCSRTGAYQHLNECITSIFRVDSDLFTIIFPSAPRFSKWYLPFRFSDQNAVILLIYHLRAHRSIRKNVSVIAVMDLQVPWFQLKTQHWCAPDNHGDATRTRKNAMMPWYSTTVFYSLLNIARGLL
jgi:hypothetical protein